MAQWLNERFSFFFVQRLSMQRYIHTLCILLYDYWTLFIRGQYSYIYLHSYLGYLFV